MAKKISVISLAALFYVAEAEEANLLTFHVFGYIADVKSGNITPQLSVRK